MNPDVLPRGSLPLPGPPPNLPKTITLPSNRRDDNQIRITDTENSARLQNTGFIAPPPPPPLPPNSQPLAGVTIHRSNHPEVLSLSSNSAEVERIRLPIRGTDSPMQGPQPLSASPLSEVSYTTTGFRPSPSPLNYHLPYNRQLGPPSIGFSGLHSPGSSYPMPNTSPFNTHQPEFQPHPPTFLLQAGFHSSNPATHPLPPPHVYNHHNSLPVLHGIRYPHLHHQHFHSTYPPSNIVPSGQIGTFHNATSNYTYNRSNHVSSPSPSRSGSTPPPPPRPPKPPELEYQQNGIDSRSPRRDLNDIVDAKSTSSEREGPAEVPVRDGEVGQTSSATPPEIGDAKNTISVDATKSPGSDTKASHFESISSSSISQQQSPLRNSPPIPQPDMMLPSLQHGNALNQAERIRQAESTSHEENRSEDTAPQEMSYRGERDDVDSDSGMTMEFYDAHAYDFPRNVNEDMVSAVSRQLPNHVATTETPPVEIQSPPRATMDSGGYFVQESIDYSQSAAAGDIDSPPPYEQISSILHLTERSELTTVVSSNISPRNETANHGSSRAEHLAPTSPPPAFGLPKPTGLTDTTAVQEGPSNFMLNLPTSSSFSLEGSTSQLSPIANKDIQTATKKLVLDDGMNPEIITSPPTPSPRSSQILLRPSVPSHFSLPRRFTVSSTGSPTSLTPSSESDDPFHDPPTFQSDASPFAPITSDSVIPDVTSPSYVQPSLDRESMHAIVGTGSTERSSWINNEISSGTWNVMTAGPSSPQSEASSDEIHRRRTSISQTYSYSPVEGLPIPVLHQPPDSGNGAPGAKNVKGRSRLTSGASSSSRISMFFRNSYSSHSQSVAADGLSPPLQPSASTLGRRGGIDLLDDSRISEDWEANQDMEQLETESPSQSLPGSTMQHSLSNTWTGIEFGFLSPDWQAPPKLSMDQRNGWHENITLYPAGSRPFFIRAPTWRGLLRFLASQSATRIEPSVEALAISRSPTIDLRLVIQFVQPRYAPRAPSREICLYFMLHSEMPAANSKVGRSIPTPERLSMEQWDTSVLPFRFVCGDKGLLKKPSREVGDKSNISQYEAQYQAISTPISHQDPDGIVSMFVTLPPPLIRLPVQLSAVAMYLHECFVLSRRQGKGKGTQEKSEGDRQKIRKGSGTRAEEGQDQSALFGDHPSSSPSLGVVDNTQRPELSPRSVIPSQVPGIKRLAKAIKTFYPEEYALGSSKSNAAAAHAAVQDDRSPDEKMTNVTNTNKHGGTNKTGLLGALSRIKGKSSAAKQAVAELSAAAGSHTGRDTNAERYELVTPWTPRND